MNKILFYFTLTSILILSSCSPMIEISNQNFSPKSQQAQTWCWAAIIQAIEQVNEVQPKEQYILVQNYFNRNNCLVASGNNCLNSSPCANNASANIELAMQKNNISFSKSNTPLTTIQIKDVISNNKPIAFIKKQPGNNNILHIVLLVGITADIENINDNNQIMLKVFDPGPTCGGNYENWTYTQYLDLQKSTYYNFKPTPAN